MFRIENNTAVSKDITMTLQVKSYQLTHPEHNATVMAAVIADWFENGRFVGFELQFPGENHTRHLKFDEIRALQEPLTQLRNRADADK